MSNEAIRHLQTGLAHHQAGRLAEAGEAYAAALKIDPHQSDALNLLGVVFYQAGNFDKARELAEASIKVAPEFFGAYINHGNALQALNRLEEAATAFEKAFTLKPDAPEATMNWSSVLNALGRHERALSAANQALALNENLPGAHNNLANALSELGEKEKAETHYRRALELAPDLNDAVYNLGKLLTQTGRHAEAEPLLKKAAAREPNRAPLHFVLGQAIQLQDRWQEAIPHYNRALDLKPDYAAAYNNLGSAYQALGLVDESVAAYRKAVGIEPDAADLHWNLAVGLLHAGLYEEGWREYEWRWQHDAEFGKARRDFEQPLWEGQDLSGKTILLHGEQGIGDQIQFARYAPLVAAKGAKVIVECRKPLVRLFETLEGVEQVVAVNDPLPNFDLHCPFMTLPLRFGTTFDTVPADIPYLSPPEGTQIHPAIESAKGFKIGICWGGSPTQSNDHNRSTRAETLAPLAALPGVTLVSLQIDDRAAELADIDFDVLEIKDAVSDFADTAAQIQALDLVVSVDTAVLHVAGALGKPAIGIMAYNVGFLWAAGGEQTPWYPSLTLYKQPKLGDWDSVMARVVEDVKGRLASAD